MDTYKMSLKAKNNNKGFTLKEIMVIFVILATLASISVFSYTKVTSKSKEEITLLEAKALAKVVLSEAGYKNRNYIITNDFEDRDLDLFLSELQRSSEREGSDPEKGSFWEYRSSLDITALIFQDGSVKLKDINSPELISTKDVTNTNKPSVSSLNLYCITDKLNSCTESGGKKAVYLSWVSSNQSSLEVTTSPQMSRSEVTSLSNNDREIYLGMAEIGTTYLVKIKVYSNNTLTGAFSSAILSYTPTATSKLNFENNTTIINNLGNYEDGENNAHIQRSEQKTDIRFETTNWSKITINYNLQDYNLESSSTLLQNRYLYKNNDKKISINIPKQNKYTLTIEYTDKEKPFIYNIL
jgi:type II secretory pathway pseudopilin PulG